MKAKMAEDGSRAHYRLRKQTVEPVFGIVKESMGFRRFLLRGLDKVPGSGCRALGLHKPMMAETTLNIDGTASPTGC